MVGFQRLLTVFMRVFCSTFASLVSLAGSFFRLLHIWNPVQLHCPILQLNFSKLLVKSTSACGIWIFSSAMFCSQPDVLWSPHHFLIIEKLAITISAFTVSHHRTFEVRYRDLCWLYMVILANTGKYWLCNDGSPLVDHLPHGRGPWHGPGRTVPAPPLPGARTATAWWWAWTTAAGSSGAARPKPPRRRRQWHLGGYAMVAQLFQPLLV